MKVDQQPGFLLHERKLSDSKRLYECITPEHGVVSLMGRAASKKQTPLMAFSPVLLSWSGKRELKNLTAFEYTLAPGYNLSGQALFCGFYVNEITQRIVSRNEPTIAVFEVFQQTLCALAKSEPPEPLLRYYERTLLEESGYAISFEMDIDGQAIQANTAYILDVQQGFLPVNTQPLHHGHRTFQGDLLLAIQKNHYQRAEVCVAAKTIMRMLLAPLLGRRPLKSRELFLTS